MKRRVVITGLGAVSPIGNTLEDIYKSLQEGYCAVDQITRFDVSNNKTKFACEVRDFKPEEFLDKKTIRRIDLVNQFGIVAAHKALNHSGIELDKLEDLNRCGVVISSGIGGLKTIQDETIKGSKRGFERISPFFITGGIANMTSALIAIELGFHGYSACPVTACAGGTNAIGDAFRSIRDGYQDLIFAGGSEASITEVGIGGFTSMKALSTGESKDRVSIPFDKERSGFVMGEGAGIIVLEELEHAKRRGAKILAELVGYGVTCDASHMTAPDSEGRFTGRAMLDAIEDAKIKPEDIDYINAHGTSTPLNDKFETLAVKNTFKEHAKNLKISSTKSMTGHLLGGSGGLEAIISVLALENGYIPPTVNYKVLDEECDLNIVPNKGIYENISYVMSNSFGFGGHNASIIIKKWEE
ncbi:beta-ketoacyl-ACP synthase II [Miniphocaeibacter halophilus]|uniref:Beta-ketoacyl-ACP synthase II n=1 Tax=Miniphocaeibacter halophilus TaxID=2931922 RepID=A0AC61MY63_9FIRM|nr:beta-ketoacyl-ACP synthase II [Miniphocaeibacter halophilus]QQK08141.1 beta-ketoacyl-ACP synthase II [Miniphocaeibacter halophilus]